MKRECNNDEVRIVVKSKTLKRIPYGIAEVRIPSSVSLNEVAYTRSRRVLYRELPKIERLRMDDRQSRAIEQARKIAAGMGKKLVIEDLARRSRMKKILDMLGQRMAKCTPTLILPCDGNTSGTYHDGAICMKADSMRTCVQ
ncbi:MAG: hypothetical protein KIY09_09695 [Thermoplasmata archaeon]|nr:hypothetical protein [Candidatus Sysuiplasma acidicola]